MQRVVQTASEHEAFVLNLSQHWFTIRRIEGVYWNLDSMKKKPLRVSDFYLSAFLAQMRQEGYSIFVVVGKLPSSQASNAALENLFSIPALLAGSSDAHLASKQAPTRSDFVQQLAQTVISAPDMHSYAVGTLMEQHSLDQASAEAELAMAMSDMLSPIACEIPGDSWAVQHQSAGAGNDGDDDELARAIALSLS
jgi:ataxin-3